VTIECVCVCVKQFSIPCTVVQYCTKVRCPDHWYQTASESQQNWERGGNAVVWRYHCCYYYY